MVIKLSNRFLNLVQQQLRTFHAEPVLERLIVYVAEAKDGKDPSLVAVGEWPKTEKVFLPDDEDPELRSPSPDRRWYPLQDGSILLGALRAERKVASSSWTDAIDVRLQATASALTNSLSLELERLKLREDLNQQSGQIKLMVHQLRNPLTALRTYAELLLRRLGPENTHRNLVEGLITEQAQLNRYISILDEIGPPENNLQLETASPLLLPPVLPKASSGNLRNLLKPLIERAKATSNLQGRQWYGPSYWPDWIDFSYRSVEGLFVEIVANLLENAFIHSPPNSDVGLSLNNNGICIWDSGPPIPLDNREKIFDKGFRGKDNMDSEGSGLGLALARQLAEELGSSLILMPSPQDFDKHLPIVGNAFSLGKPKKEMQA